MSDTSVASRATFSDHYQWPEVWEFASPVVDWTEGCRVKYAPYTDIAQVEAARADLVQTLAASPTTYWCRGSTERALFVEFGIAVHVARKLMQTCPGSAVPAPNVWCAQAAVSGWPACKSKVYDALKSDALLTFDEVKAAVDLDPTSVYCALIVLTNADKSVVCLQDDKAEEPRFCRARPGGARASYVDLVKAA